MLDIFIQSGKDRIYSTHFPVFTRMQPESTHRLQTSGKLTKFLNPKENKFTYTL